MRIINIDGQFICAHSECTRACHFVIIDLSRYATGEDEPMKRETKPTLGARLRTMRKARCWTQAGLAERAGLTQSQVSMMETGARGGRSYPALSALANAFGVSVDHLMEGVR